MPEPDIESLLLDVDTYLVRPQEGDIVRAARYFPNGYVIDTVYSYGVTGC